VIRHEHRIGLHALAAGLPLAALAPGVIVACGVGSPILWALYAGSVVVWIAITLAVARRASRPLEAFARVLASFREGDFSIRARAAAGSDALAAATNELNALGEALRRQRLEAMEASALLEKIVETVDIAVFAFDGRSRLRLVNHEGQRLLGRSRRDLLSEDAAGIGLGDLLAGEAPRTVSFPGFSAGAWELHRSPFRIEGRAHTLVVLTPIERALRERERDAWHRLARVLGHEINSSLTPIRSIAQSSIDLLRRAPRPPDADEDIARGLQLIADRAGSLGRFTTSFAELARLPAPTFGAVAVGDWIERSARAETRVRVVVDPGPTLTVRGDEDQLDQLLLNLVRNAADAVLEAGGGAVRLTWALRGPEIEVRVVDDGVGLADEANLFVPFFTTKPTGAGIGLTVARQIAEAHGGTLALRNRSGAQGCEAVLTLPR
jgi:nitrogen fixation/metabolism regulation signal transduction histidine kinase